MDRSTPATFVVATLDLLEFDDWRHWRLRWESELDSVGPSFHLSLRLVGLNNNNAVFRVVTVELALFLCCSWNAGTTVINIAIKAPLELLGSRKSIVLTGAVLYLLTGNCAILADTCALTYP